MFGLTVNVKVEPAETERVDGADLVDAPTLHLMSSDETSPTKLLV